MSKNDFYRNRQKSEFIVIGIFLVYRNMLNHRKKNNFKICQNWNWNNLFNEISNLNFFKNGVQSYGRKLV